jgi:hypothetical protein
LIRPGGHQSKKAEALTADGAGLAWSPDGTRVAYGQGSEPKYDFHNLYRLAVVPAAGGAPRVLTESLDRGTSSRCSPRTARRFSSRSRTTARSTSHASRLAAARSNGW